MNYRQRKIQRTKDYFNKVFGWSQYQFIDMYGNQCVFAIPSDKSELPIDEKFDLSGVPRHLQMKPIRLPDTMN